MLVLELACAAIVLAWLVVNLRRCARPRELLLRALVVSVSAWVCEESCIRAYGFYGYSPDWSVFVGHVPLMVALIWPVVVLSAHGMVRAALGTGSPWIPLAGGALVLTDAALIEPVSVHAGLWHWTHPGIFDVPPVGVLGWALFAGLAMAVLELDARGPRHRYLALAGLIPPAVHALLLAVWWWGFRWIDLAVPSWPAVAVAWILGLAACALVASRRPIIPLAVQLERLPAAVFFLVLMLWSRAEPALLAWALASTPAYLLLTLGARRQ